jgi:hypothetical protein
MIWMIDYHLEMKNYLARLVRQGNVRALLLAFWG